MSFLPINALTEAGLAGAYPAIHFGKREQKIVKVLKTYVDGLFEVPISTTPTLADTLLGSFTSFATLAGAGVTSTGNTVITGDLGTSPTSSITGFPPGTVSGLQHAADSVAGDAKIQLTAAKNALLALSSTATVSGDIGSTTKTAGVYDSTSTLAITGVLTLDAAGDVNAQFVFRLGTALTTAASSSIVLLNGAQADNVFFLCGSAATLGASSTFAGNIIAGTAISLGSAAAVSGRLWADTASVTFINNAVAAPIVSVALSLSAGNSFIGNAAGVSFQVSMLAAGASQLIGRVLSMIGTVTIASPGVFTSVAHGLLNGDLISLATTGALPTGLSAATAYYVVNKATDTFQLSLTSGGAAINTSGTQSGVHTISASGYHLRALSVGTQDLAAASVTLAKLASGITPSHVVKYAANYTTTGGAAAEAVTVSGVLSTDIVIASMVSPQGAQTLLKTAATNNTITFTFSADPSSSTIVAYQVLRAAA